MLALSTCAQHHSQRENQTRDASISLGSVGQAPQDPLEGEHQSLEQPWLLPAEPRCRPLKHMIHMAVLRTGISAGASK